MEFFFLIFLPFILWVISWWGFVSGKLALGYDAFYYYWDSRYFVDNIAHGVYPLWNSDYSGGVPWNFFLRRMGELNPFYWTINAAKFFGCSALQAHLAFFVLYYFLGLIGFWLLARLFLKDRLASTGAYLLLLFSWGGQLFYCFDLLIFVPLVWFFYFLFAFARQQKRHQFLGLLFAAAILGDTYVPFFALTIILTIFIFLFLFFRREVLVFGKALYHFGSRHRWFTLLSVVFLLLAFVPELNFYLESRTGNFVLPTRHVGSTDASQLAIATSSSSQGGIVYAGSVWDIIAYGYFDKLFANQKNTGIGDFNIAYPFFMIFLLAVINPLSRRTAFLLVSGVFLTVITMTKGRFYPFLMDHVFFFRYMRMLHLFLWLALLPMAILMVMEQLRAFLKRQQGQRHISVLVFVVTVHVLFGAWLLMQPGVLWSSYLVVGVSLAFFILAVMGWARRRALEVIFWLSLLIQPLVAAHYIVSHAAPCDSHHLMDRSSHAPHNLPLPQTAVTSPAGRTGIKPHDEVQMTSEGYYENPWINNLRQYIYEDNINRFAACPLLLVDNTAPEGDLSPETYIKLTAMWRSFRNLVFLPNDSLPEDFKDLSPHSAQAQPVYGNSPEVRVNACDANSLSLRTRLDRPRFLLWVNGYHPQWHVYIDGHEARLLRADLAFKGVWVPSGEHTVMFRFGLPSVYAFAWILLLMFIAVLIVVLVLGVQEGFLVEREAVDGS